MSKADAYIIPQKHLPRGLPGNLAKGLTGWHSPFTPTG